LLSEGDRQGSGSTQYLVICVVWTRIGTHKAYAGRSESFLLEMVPELNLERLRWARKLKRGIRRTR
jgi:hypothetical protein